jgi:hypothetical protein
MIRFVESKITPALAAELLKKNTINRSVKDRVVSQYAAEIVAGRWREGTGEAIKIAKDGTLLDGQHRLHAVILANRAITNHIVYNVDNEVFDVLDTGSARNAADVFRIEGIQYSSALPSIISTYHILENGGINNKSRHKKISNQLMLKMYYEEKDFWDNIAYRTQVYYIEFSKILTGAMIGGLLSCFARIDSRHAISFINQLCSGQDIKNKTIGLLRNVLIQDKLSTRKMAVSTKLALIIKTWNYYVSNKEVKNLRFKPNEEFPVISNQIPIY